MSSPDTAEAREEGGLGGPLRVRRLAALRLAHVAAILALTVFLAAFFWQLTVQHRVLSPADLVFWFYPWSTEAPSNFEHPSNHLQSDDAFLYYPRRDSLFSEGGTGFSWWQDDYLAGTRDTFSNDFLGLSYYPPAWFYHVLPFHVANGFFHVSVLLVAGVAMYLLLCELGLSPLAAFYGGLLFMLNGHFIVWLGAAPLPAILGLIPLMIFGFERYHRLRQPLYLLVPAGCLAMQIYLGYVAGWVVSGMVLTFYGAARLAPRIWARDARDVLRQAGAYTGAAALGLLLGAYSLFPSVSSALASDYQSERASGLGKVAWQNAVTYLFPNYWGSPKIPLWIGPGGNYPEWIAYFGISALPLALIGLWRLRRGWAAWFAVAVLVFCLSQVYGMEPLKSLAHLPGLKQTVAGRWHYGIPLGVAVLASMGVASLLEGDIPIRWRRILAAGVSVTMILAVLFVVWLRLFRDDGQSWSLITEGHGLVPSASDPVDEIKDFTTHLHRQMLFLLAAGGLSIVALLARPTWTRPAIVALVAVTFLDLFAFGSKWEGTVAKAHLYPPTEGLEFLEQDRGMFRIAPTEGIIPGYTANLYGLRTITGYDHYRDKDYVAFLGPALSEANVQFEDAFGYLYLDHPEAGRNALTLLNVKYVVFAPGRQPGVPWLTQVYSGRDLTIYQLDGALPRAWGVGQAEVVPSREAAFATIAGTGFDPAASAVIASEDLPDGVAAPGSAGGSFQAQIMSWDSDALTVRTNFSAPGLLMLSERFDDAWEAEVDGSEAPVLRADGILRAVPVSAGEHTVELSFEPWEYVWGRRISLATMWVVVVGVAAYLSRPAWRSWRQHRRGVV